MEIFEKLIKYWSQITVLIGITVGGIGFLLKLYFNWNLKKKEITFSKISETKIAELKNFYETFIILESQLKSLHFATAQNKKEQEIEIREKIPNIWTEFYLSFRFVRIFLNTKELEPFEDLIAELENIQLKINYYKAENDLGVLDNKLIKELRHIRNEIFPKRIPELLSVIEKNLKEGFNIE